MALFAAAKEPFLRSILQLANGLPSHDTFSRLFRNLDPEQFRSSFQRFMAEFAVQCTGVVAIDGKVARACKSEILLSGTYIDSAATPLRSTLALKTSLFNVDLFAEGIGSWTRDMPIALPSFVSGFYWEHPEPEYKFYGEYYLNAGDTTLRDQRFALATGMDKAFGSPFTLGLEWTHAFIDDSGIIIPGVSFDPWPHVTVLVGVPCRYGAPGLRPPEPSPDDNDPYERK